MTPGSDRPVPVLHATEMLPAPDEMWVRDRAGRYASELLVQLGSEGFPRPDPSLRSG